MPQPETIVVGSSKGVETTMFALKYAAVLADDIAATVYSIDGQHEEEV